MTFPMTQSIFGVTASWGEYVHCWDLRCINGGPVRVFESPPDARVYCMARDMHHGTLLAGVRHQIVCWDFATGTIPHVHLSMFKNTTSRWVLRRVCTLMSMCRNTTMHWDSAKGLRPCVDLSICRTFTIYLARVAGSTDIVFLLP